MNLAGFEHHLPALETRGVYVKTKRQIGAISLLAVTVVITSGCRTTRLSLHSIAVVDCLEGSRETDGKHCDVWKYVQLIRQMVGL